MSPGWLHVFSILSILLCLGCEHSSETTVGLQGVTSIPQEYKPVQCQANWEFELTDEEKMNEQGLYKVLVIYDSIYLQSLASFMIDFSNGLRAKGWHVFDATKMRHSLKEDLYAATGIDRYPDIVVVFNSEEDHVEKIQPGKTPSSLVIDWVDEVHEEHVARGLRKGLNTGVFDAVFPRYHHAVLRTVEPLTPRCFQMPHAASEHFFQKIDEQSKRETVLLSGAIRPNHYPLRCKAALLMEKGLSPIVQRTHPGYEYMSDPEAEGKNYSQDISKHWLAISGGGLEPGVRAPYVYAKHFEIPAAGTALLTDEELIPYLKEYGFIAGQHYIATNRDNLQTTIEHWLRPENRQELLEITKRGQELVQNQHRNVYRIDRLDRISLNLFHEKQRKIKANGRI